MVVCLRQETLKKLKEESHLREGFLFIVMVREIGAISTSGVRAAQDEEVSTAGAGGNWEYFQLTGETLGPS